MDQNIQENKYNEIIFDNINKNIYFAEIAEKTGRQNEMCKFLDNEYQNRITDFNSDERYLLSDAYRNLISIQRSSLRTINTYEAREKKKDKSYYLTYIIEYKNIVFDELKANCKRIINFIDDYLIKRAKQDEAIVFYYKMKGDFNRYIAEFAEGNLKKTF